MSVSCHKAIRQALEELGGRRRTDEIVRKVYELYPERPWKEITIRTDLGGCCVNLPSARHYPSNPKFVFAHGHGEYETYDATRHGETETVSAGDETPAEDESGTDAAEVSLGLERDLEEYLARDLGQLEPGMRLFEEQGLNGRQLSTEIGRLDLLAIDSRGALVVIELKAGTAGDAALGQLLGYVAWAKSEISKGREVRGVLVADSFQERLVFAVSALPGIDLVQYSVKFQFEGVPSRRAVAL